jgi:tetraacyldisaccharide-1-P 4'-kinase
LVCCPYSIENLHRMAGDLNIKRCWFHKDHYDIPLMRLDEIMKKTIICSSKNIVRIKNKVYE